MNFIFRGNELLVREAGLDLPDAATCSVLGLQPETLQQVWLDNPQIRTTHLPATAEAPPGYAFRKLRALMADLGDRAALAGRAFQISEWARTHKYCGVCTTPMQPLGHEFCMRCPACGMSAYPRISPAMMVLVRRGPSILLARHRNSPTRFFTALAGFLEAGESIEEAVHREVQEEVGLQVRDLRYFASQAWPFPHSLMIAFTAEYAGGELQLQDQEIEEAVWVGPGEPMPPIPPRGLSIAGHLIESHLPGR